MKRPKDFEEMNNSFRKYVVELEKERDGLRMENMIHEHNREEGDRHWPDVKKQIEDKARKPLSQELQTLKDAVRKLIEYDDDFPILNQSPFNKIINNLKSLIK